MGVMVNKQILPAVMKYTNRLVRAALDKRALCDSMPAEPEQPLAEKLAGLSGCLYRKTRKLESELMQAPEQADIKAQADYYKDIILPSMQELRETADELETLTAKDCWPYPSYSELLYPVD